nr:helix-turn-helix transcriptional regulator [uncultured Oscillibacter sp.]
MNTLNERIKKLRKGLDLTQQEFANRLGTTRNNIAGYEVGRRSPSEAVISLICKTFNVSETWLRTGEGEMFVPSPNGVLDELAQKYGLSVRGKVIVEKFLDLKPDVQEAVASYIEEVAAAFSSAGTTAAPAFAPAHIPTIEEEARAEAEQQSRLIYQQILSEKKAAAGMLSESSGPPAGGGTAKQA